MPSCSLILPCHNEARRLRRDELARLVGSGRLGQLLLVDDGSTDGTARLLESLRGEHGDRVAVITLAPNRGKAEAVRAGLLAALARGAAVVGFADADFATPAEELLRILGVLERSGAQVVMASRVARLGARIDRSPLRHLLGRGFATIAALTLSAAVYDTQCGAKWFRASEALRAALAEPFHTRWAFDVELLGRLLGRFERGGSPRAAPEAGRFLAISDILEVPLDRWRDVAGSKMTLLEMASTMAEVLTLLAHARGPGYADPKR